MTIYKANENELAPKIYKANEWQKLDRIVRATIWMHLSESVYFTVQSCETTFVSLRIVCRGEREFDPQPVEQLLGLLRV